jgi:hypothetical protein
MKYKFVETQGCTAFSFTVNDKCVSEVSKEEQKQIIDYLCEKMKERIDEGSMQLQDVVRSFGVDDWGRDEERCDQCGDTVSWEIWEL